MLESNKVDTIERIKLVVEKLIENKIVLSPENIDLLKNEELLKIIESKINRDYCSKVLDEIKYFQLINKQYIKLKKWKINPYFNFEKYVNITSTNDFINDFRERFDWFYNALKSKFKLENLVSIARLNSKKEKEKVEFVGMVQSISKSKNGNFLLTVEDLTGEIKILINKNNPKLFSEAEKIFTEDVFYIKGKSSDNIVFVDEIKYLDYFSKEFEVDIDENMIFISDLHIGSNFFCEKEFIKFIDWININSKSQDQKNIASKVKYLFISGDIIDGVGVYPNQKEELIQTTLKEQYNKASELFKKIRSDVKIIVIPGNHESVSLVEPQFIYDEKIAEEIYKIENLVVIPNPSRLDFYDEKLKILLYHGYSFDKFISSNDVIRREGGYERADIIMDLALKRRFLGSIYGSTLLNHKLTTKEIISTIPNIFVTGHFHRINVAKKKGVFLINSGCFQSTTKFQQKTGHNPDPCKAVIFNVKNKSCKVLNFND